MNFVAEFESTKIEFAWILLLFWKPNKHRRWCYMWLSIWFRVKIKVFATKEFHQQCVFFCETCRPRRKLANHVDYCHHVPGFLGFFYLNVDLLFGNFSFKRFQFETFRLVFQPQSKLWCKCSKLPLRVQKTVEFSNLEINETAAIFNLEESKKFAFRQNDNLSKFAEIVA